MCGILGWNKTSGSNISYSFYKKGINILLKYSEMRGKEASGICLLNDERVDIIKMPDRARKLCNYKGYQNLFNKSMDGSQQLVMGHARMVTNGSADNMDNNQPVIRNDLICIHNGIITNAEEIWRDTVG